MRKPITQILASLLSLVVLLPASAQDIPDDASEVEVPEIRRYAVEMIIFKYSQEVSSGSEIFIPDEIAEEGVLDELAFEEELEEEPGPLPDTEFVLLTEEELQLDEVYGHLRRINAYEPMMHFAWIQATWPEEETEAIPLRRFGKPPEGLDGNLTLYLSRFLHLVVDLQLEDAPPDVEVISQDEYRDDVRTVGELLGYADGEQPVLPVRYVIQENRILKNGELRYFDHPKFGVLAMVTRIEDEEEDPDDTGELLGYGPE